MASVNKVILIGNLGADPEMRQLPGGESVANLRLATTDVWKDKDGTKQEATEWHRVSFFGRQAEVCGQYLKKGSQIYVEGSVRTSKWKDKDGQDRYSTEVRGDRMQMLGRANHDSHASEGVGGGASGQAPRQNKAGGKTSTAFYPDDDDSIPFLKTAVGDDPILKRLRWKE